MNQSRVCIFIRPHAFCGVCLSPIDLAHGSISGSIRHPCPYNRHVKSFVHAVVKPLEDVLLSTQLHTSLNPYVRPQCHQLNEDLLVPAECQLFASSNITFLSRSFLYELENTDVPMLQMHVLAFNEIDSNRVYPVHHRV